MTESQSYGKLTEDEFCDVLVELTQLFKLSIVDKANTSNVAVIVDVAETVGSMTEENLDSFVFALTARALQFHWVQSAYYKGQDLEDMAQELFGPRPM